jgi:hypothetical protein
MQEATQTDDLFEAIAKILLRCWIFGFIVSCSGGALSRLRAI